MTCKDCVHEKVCVIIAFPEAFENTKWEKEPCDHFKNKADFVEEARCKDCGKSELCAGMNQADKGTSPFKMKVIFPEKGELYCCPGCGDKMKILIGDESCQKCGQLLDWRDFYRRRRTV